MGAGCSTMVRRLVSGRYPPMEARRFNSRAMAGQQEFLLTVNSSHVSVGLGLDWVSNGISRLYRLKAAHRLSHLTLHRAMLLILVGIQMGRLSSTRSHVAALPASLISIVNHSTAARQSN